MQGRKSYVLLAAVLLVIQLVCWRGSQRLRSVASSSSSGSLLHKRALALDTASHYSSEVTSSASKTTSKLSSTPTPIPPCQPLPLSDSPQELCDHVRQHCPPSGHLDYLQFYYCIGLPSPAPTTSPKQLTSNISSDSPDSNYIPGKKERGISPLPAHLTALRILALLCIVSWMLFLFSWVGIVASDFFCPNLGTIAARLGMSESTAGVTFLAFGNGSPDVFSTFGAMKTGSGSLAIGELIGAASYIVSVISGSMMLIAPFRVKRYPFLRDVGFFTLAVAMTMVFLFDGKLRFAECLCMIGLYLIYATTIIAGSWWQDRQRRRRLLDSSTIRSDHSANLATSQAADMERQSSQQRHLTVPSSPSLNPSPNEYDPDVDPFTYWQRSAALNGRLSNGHSPVHSPLLTGYDLPTSSSGASVPYPRFKPVTGARHSLLGAVEFRDVVRSLQQEALADRSVEIYQSRDPERFFPHPIHHHHHHHHHHHQHAHSPSSPSMRLDSDPLARRPQRSTSQRGHARVRSLVTPPALATGVDKKQRGKPVLHRSQSTIGPSASASLSLSTPEDYGWSATKHTQPSQFDATAIAAAIGDPWKEHSASDGSERTMLPLPARPLTEIDEDSNDSVHIDAKPTLRVETRIGSVSQGALKMGTRRRRSRSSLREGPPDLSQWASIKKAVSPTLRALFPSLRHLREKSWLGIALGIITAPAIFILNLTLPVVDDEAERAAMAGKGLITSGSASTGRIRLDGSSTDLYATTQRQMDSNDEQGRQEGEQSDDGHIINLDGDGSVANPWEQDGSDEEDNRNRHLQVASALRHLPHDASPLLTGDSTLDRTSDSLRVASPLAAIKSSPQPVDEVDSLSETSSCDSADSHLGNTQASHLFLVLAQCILAPPFCVWAIFSSADSALVARKTSIALLAGLLLACVTMLAILRFRRRYDGIDTLAPIGVYIAVGWARVAAGFLVSILYIMSIVDEVVSILQTLGLILGLSDAILGLTVFAMGNSLGDLVANITIAKMGHPVMAISACFAGPLLNLLLGIGISGTYLLSGGRLNSIPRQPNLLVSYEATSHHSNSVYHIDFSPTLTVSGVGLLVILVGTLIVVPLNGFYLNRAIGLSLIATYAVIMTANVLVEIYFLHSA